MLVVSQIYQIFYRTNGDIRNRIFINGDIEELDHIKDTPEKAYFKLWSSDLVPNTGDGEQPDFLGCRQQ